MKKISIKRSGLLKSALIIIVSVFLLFIVYPEGFKSIFKTDLPKAINVPFKLGLDLEGGTHLIYEADMSQIAHADQANAIEGVRDVIERRVNAFGISEPVVQINQSNDKWRIIVELAGVKDVNEAIKMIGQTPLLEFKELKDSDQIALNENKQRELDVYNANAKQIAEQILGKSKAENANLEEIAKEYKGNQVVVIYNNLGFINELAYPFIYNNVKDLEPNTIIPELIIDPSGYDIIKLNEKRDTEKQIHVKHILICYKGAEQCQNERSKEEAKKLIDDIKSRVTLENFPDIAIKESEDPGSAPVNGDLGWFTKEMMIKEFSDVAFAMKDNTISDAFETQFGYHIVLKIEEKPVKEASVERILVITKNKQDYISPMDSWANTNLSGKHLKRAHVEFNNATGEPIIALEFNEEGKTLFGEITERNLQKPLAIFLDGKAIIDTDGDGVIADDEVYAPRINDVIKEGKAEITGVTDLTVAKQLASRLNSGALPVPIELINQQTIGASLGQKSINDSLAAGFWGIILVMAFMFLYYRLPGLTSVFSLSIYAILVLLIFKIIPVTLTLAGIAGFILSIGMAVDANVLIFERMKEELRNKKTIYAAINDGFKRAWPSIRDGNLSTLITCFILAWFGTSMIKGFAITLGIGVICSMLSAIIITKIFLYAVSPKDIEKYKWLFISSRK